MSTRIIFVLLFEDQSQSLLNARVKVRVRTAIWFYGKFVYARFCFFYEVSLSCTSRTQLCSPCSANDPQLRGYNNPPKPKKKEKKKKRRSQSETTSGRSLSRASFCFCEYERHSKSDHVCKLLSVCIQSVYNNGNERELLFLVFDRFGLDQRKYNYLINNGGSGAILATNLIDLDLIVHIYQCLWLVNYLA